MLPSIKRFRKQQGFTLVELCFYMLISVVVAGVSYSFLRSSSTLAVKNANLNRSHDDLRSAFDRLAHVLSSANNIPTLINANGSVASSGPAAGLKFDHVIGEPYVVDPPLTAGTLSSSATTVSVWRSTNVLTATPSLAPPSGTNVAAEGYVFQLPLSNGTFLRKKITNISAAAASGGKQKLTLTLAASIGTTINWGANQPQVAKIVRTEAFVVVPNGGRNELRFYKDFDPLPTMSDKSKYVLLCDQIGTQSGEGTPFNIINYPPPDGGDRIVQSTLRVRERQDSAWLADEQLNNYYTYFQLHVNLPSRFRPRTTN